MAKKYKRSLLFWLFLVINTCLWAQDFSTDTGFVSFFGEKPFDEVRGDNHEVEGTINTKTGEAEFHAMIKSFHFQNKDIEKAFNEKYMESDRYPESCFIGKILNLADIDFNKYGEYQVIVEGKLTIHNVTRRVSHPGVLKVTGDELVAKSQFTVKPEDFKIRLPRMFGIKMANEINVSVDMRYSRQK
jgi:YceI-like domain